MKARVVDVRALAELAADMSGMLPVTLKNQGPPESTYSTVVLADANDAALADMCTEPMNQNGERWQPGEPATFVSFDRYVRDACNAVPALSAEVLRLRERLRQVLEEPALARDLVWQSEARKAMRG